MVLGYILSYGYVFLVLLAAAACEKRSLLDGEGRRKLVHVLLVFTWCIMVRYLGGTVHMIVVPASFVILNMVSFLKARKGDGSSVPILSSMERSGPEETPGTVYYALSIMMMGIITLLREDMVIPCGIGLFCMAFGDGMAGVIGRKVTGILATQFMREKSIGGSLACIVFSMAGCGLLALLMGYDLSVGRLAVIGVVCAVLELPGAGLDNLTVPFGCMLAAALLR